MSRLTLFTVLLALAGILAPTVTEAGLIFGRKKSGRATPVRNVFRGQLDNFAMTGQAETSLVRGGSLPLRSS